MNVQTELSPRQKQTTTLMSVFTSFFVMSFLGQNAYFRAFLFFLTIYLVRHPTVVYIIAKTWQRDVISGYRFVRMLFYMNKMERKGWTIARIFQENVKQNPTKTCFIMDERTYTYQYLGNVMNKVGSYFKTIGLQRNDCVVLLMETRVEYICIWLGLSAIGVKVALINSSLKGETLLHSIKVANAKAIIVGSELASCLKDILHHNDIAPLPIYQYSDNEQLESAKFEFLPGATNLTKELDAQKIMDLSVDIESGRLSDKLLCVYTSGTTGLPKAAVITNLRYLYMCSAVYFMVDLRTTDVIYNPLPLYHTAGGIVAAGISLIHGATSVLRKKFSVSNFWKDCIKYDCTAAQYIGELCRYLLSAPPKPEDTMHNMRVMYGNGLRPQIWQQFMSRFQIPLIGELYGSTEGNSNLANVVNQVGAMGFVPVFGRKFLPIQSIKCDEETGEPIRNKAGYCIRTKPGETGLLIGMIDHKRAGTAFNGYEDKEASQKKILKDVFVKGDFYFNSGDMAVSDLLGYFYFKDRTGDTFRWRGENVATSEVEAIITNVVGLQDCVVYGVDIPHVEGKAGMAAIEDPKRRVDLQQLSSGIRANLPHYAQPLFVRLMNDIPRTDTFKMKKRDLTLEGFNIHKISDPIFYLQKNGTYALLDEAQYAKLVAGESGL
ncbi:long-chain fatty acid transport protein 4 [Teleopsis dalmanni]|uniref:long-chain fatty acid transport protein 4 n=1 Tax=Teleopsis dalmanni TaxID=139649 RepID=UPI000D32AACA|nr:long-chain fatty acid transport protein 4 [Teleopsis dalmanni]